jgi:hypothetical protein
MDARLTEQLNSGLEPRSLQVYPSDRSERP